MGALNFLPFLLALDAEAQPTARFNLRGSRAGSMPSTDTLPACARSSAARTRMSVDLPAPFLPRSTVTCPRESVRSSASSTVRPR